MDATGVGARREEARNEEVSSPRKDERKIRRRTGRSGINMMLRHQDQGEIRLKRKIQGQRVQNERTERTARGRGDLHLGKNPEDRATKARKTEGDVKR